MIHIREHVEGLAKELSWEDFAELTYEMVWYLTLNECDNVEDGVRNVDQFVQQINDFLMDYVDTELAG